MFWLAVQWRGEGGPGRWAAPWGEEGWGSPDWEDSKHSGSRGPGRQVVEKGSSVGGEARDEMTSTRSSIVQNMIQSGHRASREAYD